MLAWDDLRFVLAVADAGSLSGAGRALRVSHPTVFRRIAEIEARIGTRLFERRPDGYAITAAGEEVRSLARRMREDVSALEHRLAGRDIRLAGTVRLTTADTIAAVLVPPVLARLRDRHPGIVVEVSVSNAFASLTKREADIAVRPTDNPPEALVGRRVATIRVGVYAASSRRLGKLTPRALAKQDWIGFDDSLAHLKSASWLAREMPPERIVLRTDSITALHGAARAGLGLALLPSFLGDGDPLLERVAGPLPEADTGLWLLTHRGIRDVPRVRVVLDALAKGLAARR